MGYDLVAKLSCNGIGPVVFASDAVFSLPIYPFRFPYSVNGLRPFVIMAWDQ